MNGPAIHGQLPPFSLIEPEPFQALARDVLLQVPEVSTADVYGKRGQAQRGVDVVAHLQSGEVDVAQVKRFQSIDASEIVAASDIFVRHLDHWKSNRVRKFILFTSADVTNRDVQDQIAAEKRRFAKVGIAYEVWSPPTITRLIEGNRGLVTRYFEQAWVDYICGTDVLTLRQSLSIASSQATDAAAIIEHDAQRMFEAGAEALRTGDVSECDANIRALLAPLRLARLRTEDRLRIRELAARYFAYIDDLSEAQRILEAPGDPDPSGVLDRARIIVRLQRGESPQLLISEISERREPRLIELRAMLHITARDLDGADRALELLADMGHRSPERSRLQAIVALQRYDLERARRLVKDAVDQQAPPSEAIRALEAVIQYWSAIRVELARPVDLLWPQPVHKIFIAEDRLAVDSLRRAAREFRALGDSRAGSEGRNQYRVWELAALAALPPGGNDITDRIRELADNPSAVGLLLSGLSGIEPEQLIPRLERLRASGDAAMSDLAALVSLYQRVGRHEEAITLLDERRDGFIRAGMYDMANAAYVTSRVALGDIYGAEEIADHISDPLLDYFSRAVIAEARAGRSGDRSHLATVFARFRESPMPIPVYSLLDRYTERDFDGVSTDGAKLIEVVNTARFSTMIARSQAFSGAYESALATLDVLEAQYASESLPDESREFKAGILYQLGDVVRAIAEYQILRTSADSPRLQETVLTALVLIGDFTGLRALAYDLLASTDAALRVVVGLAQVFADRDPHLSRVLLERALAVGLTEELAPAVYTLSICSDYDDGARAALPFIETLQSGPNPVLIPVRHEDVATVAMQRKLGLEKSLQDYAAGEMPLHVVAEAAPDLFVALLFDVPERNASVREQRAPVFAVHGSRPSSFAAASLAAATSLYLDLTTIVLCSRVGVLDSLLSCGKRVYISRDTIMALVNANLVIGQPQPRSEKALSTVLDLPVTDANDDDAINVSINGDAHSVAATNFVRSLRKSKVIADEEWQDAQLTFGSLEDTDADPLPQGQSLRLDGGAAYMLARAGLMPRLLSRYNVAVSVAERTATERRREENEQRRKAAARVRDIVDLLSTQIANGRILLTARRKERSLEIASELRNLALIAVDLDAQRALPGAPAALCIDDRTLNTSTRSTGGLPICTMSEILPYLRDLRLISADFYFDALARARESLICFIAITSDELYSAIAESTIDISGAVRESRRLSAIRSYLERTFELISEAKIERDVTLRPSEAPYFLSSLATVRGVQARVSASSDLAAHTKVSYLDGLEKSLALRLSAAGF